MRLLVALLVVTLCACAPVEPLRTASFRDQNAPIGGTTRYDPARFAGDWHVIAVFGAGPSHLQRFAFDPSSAVVTGPSGRQYRMDGPGVLKPEQPGIGEMLVIMWVDEGFRTAAIGHPSGSYGVILDRNPTASPDRLAAAKDILDWYGWDLTKLKEVTK